MDSTEFGLDHFDAVAKLPAEKQIAGLRWAFETNASIPEMLGWLRVCEPTAPPPTMGLNIPERPEPAKTKQVKKPAEETPLLF